MSSSFCASVIMLAVLGQASAFADVGVARRSVYSRLSVAMHAHQNASAVERRLPPTMKAGARGRAMLLAPRGLGSTLLRNPLSRAGVEAMRMPAFFDLLDPAVQKSIERPLEELVDRYIHDIASKQLVIDEKERAMQRVIDEKERVIDEKERVIDEKERVIDEKERVIDEKERVIDEKERIIQEKEERFHEKKADMQKHLDSKDRDIQAALLYEAKLVREVVSLHAVFSPRSSGDYIAGPGGLGLGRPTSCDWWPAGGSLHQRTCL
eukprot:scaffold6010_cov121-Isochrysis_galbana.AAC.5